jgi:hypothetical protein
VVGVLVLDFLGLGPFRLPNAAPRNRGTYDRESVPGEAALREHFRPHNEALAEHLGMALDWS